MTVRSVLLDLTLSAHFMSDGSGSHCRMMSESPRKFSIFTAHIVANMSERFHVAAFCQRIVNSAAPLVKPNLTPEKLRNASGQLKSAPTAVEADRQHILRLRTAFFSRMPAAKEDSTGFNVVCEQSGIRWVRVWFNHELASRGDPAPRCQDMPDGSYLEGQ